MPQKLYHVRQAGGAKMGEGGDPTSPRRSEAQNSVASQASSLPPRSSGKVLRRVPGKGLGHTGHTQDDWRAFVALERGLYTYILAAGYKPPPSRDPSAARRRKAGRQAKWKVARRRDIGRLWLRSSLEAEIAGGCLGLQAQLERWSKAYWDAVLANSGLLGSPVKSCLRAARLYMDAEVAYEELSAIGQQGLRRAVECFDPSLGYAFSTYARTWIEHELKRHGVSCMGPVHVPAGVVSLTAHNPGLSLDAPLFPDGDTSLSSVLPSPSDGVLERSLARFDTEALFALWRRTDGGPSLSSSEDYSGHTRWHRGRWTQPMQEWLLLERLRGRSLDELSDALGLSRERVRQVLLMTLHRLAMLAGADPERVNARALLLDTTKVPLGNGAPNKRALNKRASRG